MKLIQQLPFESQFDDQRLECGLWQSDENICDLNGGSTICDPSSLYYGTLDSREPHFCARHFYQEVVIGDGAINYKLLDRK